MTHAKLTILAATACAALVAAAPSGAQSGGRDEEAPRVRVAGDTESRCAGRPTRLTLRVADDSPTRTLVRLDGRPVRSSTRKRFTVRLELGRAPHVIGVVARDRPGNRFTYKLRLARCTD